MSKYSINFFFANIQEFAARYAVIWVVPYLTFENDKQVQVQFCAFSSKWHGAVEVLTSLPAHNFQMSLFHGSIFPHF